MELKDTAKEIREGESLDIDKVSAYLNDHLDRKTGPLTVKQFPGGYSNLTYLLSDGKTEMVLRRPPIGAKIKSAHDMGREFRILSALKPVFPYCPTPLCHCEDESVIGAPFYVMERLSGIILRKELPEGLSLTPQMMKGLCEKLLDIQVELHTIDVKKNGLDFLGKPEGYVKRQVEGWSERYRKARTDDAPDFEVVMGWLKEKMQKDTGHPGIVHNDYRFDNVVLDEKNPMNIIGVLDWEMATYGDPLMDLGNSMAYWIEKNDPEDIQTLRPAPTNLPGALTRKELVDRYAEKTGREISAFDFYYAFGLFRLAVIVQQIYNRFYHGITKDKRFGMLIFGVHILEKRVMAVIEQSTL